MEPAGPWDPAPRPIGRLRLSTGRSLRWMAERLIDAGEWLLNIAMRILTPRRRR